MPSHPKRRDRALLCALLAITAFLYAPVLKAGFVYDDWWYLVKNPALKTWNITSFFTQPSTVAAAGSGLDEDVYRPMGTFANAVAYHVWGLRPWPYHLFCLSLHLLNGVLLFGFLWAGFTRITEPLSLECLWHLTPVTPWRDRT